MSNRRRAFSSEGYKPSGLRVLSGPASPASPLSPLPSQLHFPLLPSPRSTSSAPLFGSVKREAEAPPEAMPWIWSCHKCHTRYPLGATRRCLNDGHLFCGGTTVDKVTGKIKKHRACASEFDYIGWEGFGVWKRKVTQPKPAGLLHKHCERQCDFPSACHWKVQHTPKKDANFGFLDPKCLGTETKVSPAAEKSTLKKTGSGFIDKLVKAAEKRTTQLSTLLSTIEEEKNFTSTPGYVSSPTVAPQKLPEVPSLNAPKMSFPVLDFSSFKGQPSDRHSTAKNVEMDSTPSETSPPELSSSTSSSDDEDVDMTDWISEADTTSYPPPHSPTSAPHPDFVSFNFGIDTNQGADVLSKSLSPVSPTRDAWDFTTGDIGIALGSPTKASYEGSWDMGVGLEDEHMLWSRDLHILGRKVSV